MNKKGIGVIAVIVGTIIVFGILSMNTAELAPPIVDTTQISDQSKVKASVNALDDVDIEDQGESTQSNFYIDEEGIKHHIIEAIDELELSE